MVVWEYFKLHEYQGWSSPLPHLFRGYKNLSQYVTEMMRKVLRKFILKAFHLLSHTASPPFGPIVLIFWKDASIHTYRELWFIYLFRSISISHWKSVTVRTCHHGQDSLTAGNGRAWHIRLNTVATTLA